jgi:hypothetical protein
MGNFFMFPFSMKKKKGLPIYKANALVKAFANMLNLKMRSMKSHWLMVLTQENCLAGGRIAMLLGQIIG